MNWFNAKFTRNLQHFHRFSVSSTRHGRFFCMETIGTTHQSVEFLCITGKWKDQVSIFRSQYQNKFFMSSLFATLSSIQLSTARSALMYKCYHSINLTWNVLTTMMHTKFCVKFQQGCHWAIMGVFCLLTPFWLNPALCKQSLAVRKCRTQDQSTKDDLTNQGHAYKRNSGAITWPTKTIKMQMAASQTE